MRTKCSADYHVLTVASAREIVYDLLTAADKLETLSSNRIEAP
jgi:hypothetical protein